MPSLNKIYFNDHEKYVVQWLKNLYPKGVVDDRSITDIDPRELTGYKRAHFFAGIGGWEYALELAGWSKDQTVWTGSCPCQPFSVAGRGKGTEDERHLWPSFLHLIEECRPPAVFGEQVASSAGRKWLAGVRSDLEDLGYVVGCADLCAAGVGAPHIRQRLYWVAYPQKLFQSSGFSYRRSLPKEVELLSKPRNSGPTKVRPRVYWDGDKPDVFMLAHGVPQRASKLRAYGNAIVPQVAAAFIQASMLAIQDCRDKRVKLLFDD